MADTTDRSRVSVAIPVYRRLEYLESALRSVAEQDYENIDLIVSDNGLNGPELEDLVAQHYPRPFRFRRNQSSVGIVDHFNQLVDCAEGDYFVLLSDDDELTPGYLSRLVSVLDGESDVALALGRLEVMDEAGAPRPARNVANPPLARMSAEEFVGIWARHEYNFVCFVTFMARTAEIRAVGGFPPFPKGTSVDNGLVLKLCLNRTVAFESDAVFRYRVYESSHGLALPYRELARDLREFLVFLDSDPVLESFAREHPRAWSGMRAALIEMTWRTYRSRWRTMYRRRLSRVEWVRAAFAMPFIPAYYRAVLGQIARTSLRPAARLLRRASRGRGAAPS